MRVEPSIHGTQLSYCVKFFQAAEFVHTASGCLYPPGKPIKLGTLFRRYFEQHTDMGQHPAEYFYILPFTQLTENFAHCPFLLTVEKTSDAAIFRRKDYMVICGSICVRQAFSCPDDPFLICLLAVARPQGFFNKSKGVVLTYV